jgi:uncharacterized protein DUF1778
LLGSAPLGVVERKTVSAFILDKGLSAAAETLADRREFPLSANQYDAFVAALDAPSKSRALLVPRGRDSGALHSIHIRRLLLKPHRIDSDSHIYNMFAQYEYDCETG